EPADGVAGRVAADLDAVVAVGLGGVALEGQPDGGVDDLDAGRVAGDLNAVVAVAGDDVEAEDVVAPGRGDEHAVPLVAAQGVVERGRAAEGVEGYRLSGRVADLEAVVPVAGGDVAQRDDAAEEGVGGRPLDEHAVEGVGHRRLVVSAQAEEV